MGLEHWTPGLVLPCPRQALRLPAQLLRLGLLPPSPCSDASWPSCCPPRDAHLPALRWALRALGVPAAFPRCSSVCKAPPPALPGSPAAPPNQAVAGLPGYPPGPQQPQGVWPVQGRSAGEASRLAPPPVGPPEAHTHLVQGQEALDAVQQLLHLRHGVLGQAVGLQLARCPLLLVQLALGPQPAADTAVTTASERPVAAVTEGAVCGPCLTGPCPISACGAEVRGVAGTDVLSTSDMTPRAWPLRSHPDRQTPGPGPHCPGTAVCISESLRGPPVSATVLGLGDTSPVSWWLSLRRAVFTRDL